MEVRERILTESAQLFFGRGIKSVTMNDVANHIGISKRTLYEVFKDKDQLIRDCMDSILLDSNNRAMEHFRKHENVILGFIVMYEENLKNLSQMNRTAIRDLGKYYPDIYKRFLENGKNVAKIYENVLNEGISKGYIRKDLNVEIVVELLQSQIRGLMENEQFVYLRYPLSEYMKNIIMNFVRGISTETGLRMVDQFIMDLDNENKVK